MNKISLFFGIEFEWLAVDTFDHISLMFTGGSGPIPARAIEIEHQLATVFDQMLALPVCGEYKLIDWDGSYRSDWIELARRGVFAYDWSRSRKSYMLIAEPMQPLVFAQLAEANPELSLLAVRIPLAFGRSVSVPSEESTS